MSYDINYKKLITLLLPTFLRRSVIRAFLRAGAASINRLHNNFIGNRNANIYRTRMNGQVCYLRRVLNDAFPDADNSIRIEDGAGSGQWLYAYDEEYDPYRLFLSITDTGTLIPDREAIIEGASGFIVFAPRTIFNVNNDAKMRALLNEYKLLSKNYTIVYE